MSHSLTLYLTTILIWGSTWYAIKFQLGEVAPQVSLLYRFGLASLLLIVFCIFTRRSLKISPSEHVFVAAQGVCLFSLNYLIFYVATGYLTSGLVAVVFSSVIFMNMFNGALFLRRAIDHRVFAGAVFGLIGISMVFWPELSGQTASNNTIRGLLYCVVATYFASLGNILSARNQQAGLGVIQTNTLGMGYGALFMLVWVLISGVEINFDTRLPYVASLLYLSIFGSIVAFGAYLTLIGRTGADRAAYATVLFPIVALLISSVFEGYQWTLVAVGGVVCVLFGNLLVKLKAN